MSGKASATQGRRQQRLLPRESPTQRVDRTAVRPADAPLKPKLPATAAACSACRTHKVKCFGERPSCRRCLRQDIPCLYTTQLGETPSQALIRSHRQLQSRALAFEELFGLLKDLPAEDAQNVFRMIRSGENPSTIIKHVNTGDILLQMAVTPGTELKDDGS